MVEISNELQISKIPLVRVPFHKRILRTILS